MMVETIGILLHMDCQNYMKKKVKIKNIVDLEWNLLLN